MAKSNTIMQQAAVRRLLEEVACSEVAALDTGPEGTFCGICEAPLHYNDVTEQTEGHEADCLTIRVRTLLQEIDGQ